MLDFLVFLFIGALLLGMILNKEEENKLLLLIIGLFCIPASAVALSQSPFLDVKGILLYLYIITSYVNSPTNFKESVRQFPFKIPCLVVLLFFIITAYLGADGSIKRVYDSVRIYIDSFGFLFAAFSAGRKMNYEIFYKKFFILILVLCGLGFIEHFIHNNIPYQIICSAFPYYDGYVRLDGVVSFDQDWRYRINILTKHPTALGTMLCIFFLTILPLTKNYVSTSKKYLCLGLLFAVTLFSGSRTALLCIALFSFYYFISKKKIFSKMCIIVAIAVAASNVSETFIQDLTTKGQGSSIELRQEQMAFSYLLFLQSPYFGNGLRFMEKYIVEDGKNGQKGIDNVGGLESIVFMLLIDQGIFGLISYFFFICWMILFFRKQAKMGHTEGIQGLLVLSSCTLFFILSGHIGANEVMCYTFVGMLAGGCVMAQKSSEKSNEKIHNASVPSPQKE